MTRRGAFSGYSSLWPNFAPRAGDDRSWRNGVSVRTHATHPPSVTWHLALTPQAKPAPQAHPLGPSRRLETALTQTHGQRLLRPRALAVGLAPGRVGGIEFLGG